MVWKYLLIEDENRPRYVGGGVKIRGPTTPKVTNFLLQKISFDLIEVKSIKTSKGKLIKEHVFFVFFNINIWGINNPYIAALVWHCAWNTLWNYIFELFDLFNILVFEVAESESEIRFSKFNMADPIWRTKTLKITWIGSNSTCDFQNTIKSTYDIYC